MATVLGLAMKVTADTSGFTQSLDPVDRALQGIQKQADSTIDAFDKFAASSTAAANMQQETAYQLTLLQAALKDGQISAQEFAAEFASIQAVTKENVAALQEAADIMTKYSTETDNNIARQERLTQLYNQGLIDLQAYMGEMNKLNGVNEAAAASEKARADAAKAAADAQKYAEEQLKESNEAQNELEKEAQKIREANTTAIDKYEQRARVLFTLKQQGLITDREYNAEIQKARDNYTKAAEAAAGLTAEVKKVADSRIQFNELTGIIGLLPGSIGSVATRISGLSSAAGGFGKIFDGGLRPAISGVADMLGGLFTKANLVAGGLAAFGAAATAVWNGLEQLAGRVENLTNLAVRMGASFESVQVLDEAAKRAGSSVEAVASAMQKFSVRVNEARSGSGDAAEAFEKLGISQETLRRAKPDELAKLTADALMKIEDPALRAALATDTLGKKGLSLIPTFQSIGEASEAMERFGGAISDIDQQRLLALDVELDNIKTSMMGFGNELLLPFTGVTEGIASLFADVVGALTQIIAPIGDAIAPIFDAFGKTIGEFGETLYNIGAIIGRLITIGLTPFTNVMQALGPAISPAKLVLEGINAVLEGLIFVIDQAIAAWNGFADSIPLVGQYLKVAANDGKTAVGELRDEAEEPLDIGGEGVSKEFEKTLENVQKNLSKAIDESAKFGEAGFNAALQYQESIKQLQAQFDAGILNETAFARAAAEADAAYKQQIDTIKEATKETERKAKAEEDAAKKAREAIDKAIEESERALIRDQQFGGDEKRMKAAEMVATLNEEIARTEAEIAQARAAGDAATVQAGNARLAQLDQLKAREEDIASGEAARREKDAKEQEKRDKDRAKKLEDINKKIADEQQKITDKVLEQEVDRLKALDEVRGGAVKVGDLRSTEGASTFLNLAAGKMDPAIEEYRKQLKELQNMRKDLQKLDTQKAEILAGEA